ncbi:hypothetical protein D8674_012471 [Pyrus ussuriensis x Pyrus communis]|uniref:Uncharacterized protein n=1 Tax=Pyrus ussuriensis x Pyrus communis TaxID=2448454 RepID=A0A5N5G1Q8_9ROSA|nr:hypothetical protein D8674_012471 [Pyrus ussuriensis x Pyrus communis]
MKSFELLAQSMVIIEELDGDEDDQCNLIKERPVQVNRGKAKLAIEYPVSGLGAKCSMPSQCVTQAIKEVPDEKGDAVVGEEYVDVCYFMYLEIYGHLIQPMNEMSMWEIIDNPPIQPLLYTRQPGRSKKKRNKEAAEKEK